MVNPTQPVGVINLASPVGVVSSKTFSVKNDTSSHKKRNAERERERDRERERETERERSCFVGGRRVRRISWIHWSTVMLNSR